MLPGGWNLAPMSPCNLPENVATGFAQLFGNMEGAAYTPVLYCGTQVVNGINHMIICRQTLVTPTKDEHLVKVIINESPNAGWTLVLIDQII